MSDQGNKFWKRKSNNVPGRAKPRKGKPDFKAFDTTLSEAWSDGEDEFTRSHGISFSQPNIAPTATTSSKPDSIAQDQEKNISKQMQNPAEVKNPPSEAPDQHNIVQTEEKPPSMTDLSINDSADSTDDVDEEAGYSLSTMSQRQKLKFDKFSRLLDAPNVDLAKLREAAWSGIPAPIRSVVWRLLVGYLPANAERRADALKKKRSEYRDFVDRYYTSRDHSDEKIHHQIHIDVLRTNPTSPFFRQPAVQELMQRVLYIWAIRHPGSGYVQGINDLLTPFITVFLKHYPEGRPLEQCAFEELEEQTRYDIEADCFWCLSKVLDGIQDNYTHSQPGIQKKLHLLQELIVRVDEDLHKHLEHHGLAYVQFAFRWMNCLLMRELPMNSVIRLWDTYLCEDDGFSSFHVYACAAFLTHFSEQLKAQTEFQTLMTHLQHLPTDNWTDGDVDLLLAEAFKLKYMFHNSQKHFT